jgi:hypothetical protein
MSIGLLIGLALGAIFRGAGKFEIRDFWSGELDG